MTICRLKVTLDNDWTKGCWPIRRESSSVTLSQVKGLMIYLCLISEDEPRTNKNSAKANTQWVFTWSVCSNKNWRSCWESPPVKLHLPKKYILLLNYNTINPSKKCIKNITWNCLIGHLKNYGNKKLLLSLSETFWRSGLG